MIQTMSDAAILHIARVLGRPQYTCVVTHHGI